MGRRLRRRRRERRDSTIYISFGIFDMFYPTCRKIKVGIKLYFYLANARPSSLGPSHSINVVFVVVAVARKRRRGGKLPSPFFALPCFLLLLIPHTPFLCEYGTVHHTRVMLSRPYTKHARLRSRSPPSPRKHSLLVVTATRRSRKRTWITTQRPSCARRKKTWRRNKLT